MGGRLEQDPDELRITGVPSLTGAAMSSFNDHRVLMALAVAASRASGTSTLTYPRAYRISYPMFLDEMNGIDWQKGCYMGQELTARTKYRALVKKRLLPVRIDGALPPAGTPVMLGNDEAGELRSGRDGRALALLRLDAVTGGGALMAGTARITPEKPGWMKI